MAYSYINYVSDGSTAIYNVPFLYIDKENITITVNDVECLDVTYATASTSYVETSPEYAWVTDSSIQFVVAPPTALVIKIQRYTEKEESVVDFTDGAVLTADDLDTSTLQLLYVVQEAYDALEGTGIYELADSIEETYQEFLTSSSYYENAFNEIEEALLEAVEEAEYWANEARDIIPIATTEVAGKILASDSINVDPTTGEATVPIASTTSRGAIMASESLSVDQTTGEATVPTATTSLAGIVERATNDEVIAGADTTKYVTPYHLGLPYGTCSTGQASAAKVVTLSGFILKTGARISVLFTNANTATTPTLNVNDTGAKDILCKNTTTSHSGIWSAGDVVTFVYTGTQWAMDDINLVKTVPSSNFLSMGVPDYDNSIDITGSTSYTAPANGILTGTLASTSTTVSLLIDDEVACKYVASGTAARQIWGAIPIAKDSVASGSTYFNAFAQFTPFKGEV